MIVGTVDRCEPVPRVVNALSDSQLAVKDSVVRYTCFEGSVALDSSAMSTLCDGTNWTPALSQCEGDKYLQFYTHTLCPNKNRSPEALSRSNCIKRVLIFKEA